LHAVVLRERLALTPREAEALAWLARGKSSRDVDMCGARALYFRNGKARRTIRGMNCGRSRRSS
jgi:hypothetical protein